MDLPPPPLPPLTPRSPAPPPHFPPPSSLATPPPLPVVDVDADADAGAATDVPPTPTPTPTPTPSTATTHAAAEPSITAAAGDTADAPAAALAAASAAAVALPQVGGPAATMALAVPAGAVGFGAGATGTSLMPSPHPSMPMVAPPQVSPHAHAHTHAHTLAHGHGAARPHRGRHTAPAVDVFECVARDDVQGVRAWLHTDTGEACRRRRESDGLTVLCLAAQSASLRTLRMLMYHPLVDVNYPAADGAPPLLFAARTGREDVVDLLLSGCRVDKASVDAVNRAFNIKPDIRWRCGFLASVLRTAHEVGEVEFARVCDTYLRRRTELLSYVPLDRALEVLCESLAQRETVLTDNPEEAFDGIVDTVRVRPVCVFSFFFFLFSFLLDCFACFLLLISV